MKRFCLALLITLTLVDCGGGDGGTGPTPSTITISTGDDQVGAAGTALSESLAVIVRDAGSAPLAGVNVTFTIASGGGSVSPASRVTDAAGIAKTRRTLGPSAGPQLVNATAGSLAPVQFSAVSQIQGAVTMANNTSPPLTDTVGAIKAESLTVLVTDQNATPVQGVTVAWAASGGTVSSASVPTSAAGLSKVRFTYGTATGNKSATATVTGLGGSPVTINFVATAGTAVSIVKTAGDNGTAAPSSNVNYTVQSRDTHGNPKGGVVVDWAVATGGGSISPAQNTTAGNGNASATRTLGSGTGNQTATATAAGLTGAPVLTFTTNAQPVTVVQVSNNQFSPNAVTIPRTGTVLWDWQAGGHNVTLVGSTSGWPGNIDDQGSGAMIAGQFNTAGTFNYRCTNHPGMNGSVQVNP